MADTDKKPAPRFEPKKVYLKDVSFESPNTPDIFIQGDVAPELDVQMNLQHKLINQEKQFYEVVLYVTASAKEKESTLFLAEIQQAGIFTVKNFSAENLPAVLEIACPNVLLPFAREEIANLVSKGGFPQLLLNPINFEALYAQKQRKVAQSVAEKTDSKLPH